jgi:hypothetical protein
MFLRSNDPGDQARGFRIAASAEATDRQRNFRALCSLKSNSTLSIRILTYIHGIFGTLSVGPPVEPGSGECLTRETIPKSLGPSATS